MKRLILFTFFALFTSLTFAQDKVFKMTPQDSIVPKVKEERVPDEIISVENPRILGGNVWFSVWGNYRYFDFSPIAAYKLNSKFHVGAGATYRYISGFNLQGRSSDYSVYGGRVFMRYMLFEGFFPHVEYEYLLGLPTVILNNSGTSYVESREWIGGALVGGSYRSKLGENTNSVLTILYNATHREGVTPNTSRLVLRVSFEYDF
jgi:hypothetical protein